MQLHCVFLYAKRHESVVFPVAVWCDDVGDNKTFRTGYNKLTLGIIALMHERVGEGCLRYHSPKRRRIVCTTEKTLGATGGFRMVFVDPLRGTP